MGSSRIKYILSFIAFIGLLSCEKPNNDKIWVAVKITNPESFTIKYFNGDSILTRFISKNSIEARLEISPRLKETDSLYFYSSNGHPFKIWMYYDGSPQFYGDVFDSINIHKPLY